MFESPEATGRQLAERGYFADLDLSTSLFLSLRMGKPLFLEGEPGVGKTEVGRVVADLLATPLIRLQCYEGLDINHAVYEWNHPRQLLEIQARGGTAEAADIWGEAFLLRRPLLQAIDRGHERSPVLPGAAARRKGVGDVGHGWIAHPRKRLREPLGDGLQRGR